MGLLRVDSDHSLEGVEQIVPHARRSVFVGNTDTLARLYRDFHLTQTLPNPLTADASGKFPDCFVESGRYRVTTQSPKGEHIQLWSDLRVSEQMGSALVGGFASLAKLQEDTALSYASVTEAHSILSGDLVRVLETEQTYRVADPAETSPHVTTAGGVKLLEAGRRYSTLPRFQDAVNRGETYAIGDVVFAAGTLYHFVGGTGETTPGLVGWDLVTTGATGGGSSGPEVTNTAELVTTPPSGLVDGSLLRTGEEGFIYRVNFGADASIKLASGMGFDVIPHDNLSAKMFGAIGDGSSHPLSERYSTLAEAQAVYPHATALTDEIDWCAWQGLANHLYDRDNPTGTVTNWSCGSVIVDGQFVVNRTITFNMTALKVEGQSPGIRFGAQCSQSSFIYDGPDGTVDAPIWIMDCWLFDEFANPPPGRNGNGVMGGGGKYEITGVTFYGKGGVMAGLVGDESGFISGLRIRKASFSKIENCTFGGTLWDGVSLTDGQLFFIARRNFFYGCYRDGLAIHRVHSGYGFSTTCWIYNNEFGYVGRYHILGDFRGSIDADPRIRDNSFELGNNNFFPNDPDWWVNGVVSPVCLIEAGNLIFDGNRCEAITDTFADYWADVHLVGGIKQRLVGGVVRNVFLSSLKNSADMNAALSADAATRGYRDITNTRNYNCGVSGDTRTGVQELTIEGLNINKLLIAAQSGVGTSNTGRFQFSGATCGILAVPVVSGTYADQVMARPVAPAEFENLSNYVAMNSLITDYYGARNYFYGSPTAGLFTAMPDQFSIAAWAPSSTINADVAGLNWRNARRPTTSNGFSYQAMVGGTTGTTEPVWPTSIGATVVDGDVTWKCVALAYDAAHVGNNGKLTELSYNKSVSWAASPPTAGKFFIGEKVMNTHPSAGGNVGWVCVNGGTPGTWKAFGSVDS